MGIFNFLSKKNELKDFFKIDIENIFKYNPQFSHSEKTESGTSVIGIILPEIGAVTDILLIACVFICISHLIFLYNKYTTQTKINQQFIQKNIEI